MICEHPERASIEDARLRKVACAKLATQYGVSMSAIYRHDKHLGRSVVCAGATPLVDRVETLINRIEKIACSAESAKEWKSAIQGMREIRESIELLARLTGQMPLPGRSVSVGVSVNVSAGHSRNDASNHDLDLQIAADVREATNDFDPQVIARMKRLLERYTPLEVGDNSSTATRTALLE